MLRSSKVWALGACFALAVPSALGQQAPAKRAITSADAPQWETLSTSRLSNDGRFLFARLNSLGGESRLIIRATDGPILATVPLGSAQDTGSVAFDETSRWLGTIAAPPKATADRLREERKPIELRFLLRSLETGQEFVFENVASFRFLKGSPVVLMSRQRPPEAPPTSGSDLIVFRLDVGRPEVLGNVTAFAVNDAENLIAYETAFGGYESVGIFQPQTGVQRTLEWGKTTISALAFAGKTDALGYLRGSKVEGKEGNANQVVLARNVASEKPTFQIFDPARIDAFPKDKRIVEGPGIRFNDDASIAVFGIQTWAEPKKPEGRPQDRATVEIWSTQDIRVIPEQRLTANRDRNLSVPVAWRPAQATAFQAIVDDKDLTFFTTTTSAGNPVQLEPNLRFAIVLDPKPYQKPNNDGIARFDLWRVDTLNGKRDRLVTELMHAPALSREGNFVTFWQRGHWWLAELATGKVTNMTGKVRVSFEDELFDGTQPVRPPEANPLWLANDSACILYDRFDAWLFRPGTGDLTLLTPGRKDKISFRFADVESLPDGPTLDGPMYFRAFDEETKASGYYLADGKGAGKMVAFDNMSLSGLSKIKGGDRFSFVMQSFEKSPNVFVTNGQFSAIKAVTATNPQQASFTWGKAELVPFKSRWGAELNGILVYPADYQPGRRYPMVTYIYERLSDALHQYQVPLDWNAYDEQMLSQAGYFVFMPDIAYHNRRPGQSALDCLEPGVMAVLKKNVGVDPTKVGLIGHSWGGYQAAFVTTVSKMFAVGVAGAPLTDLPSMHGSFYANVGITNASLLETSQGRMGVPFYEDLETYLKESPVHRSKERTTPLLIAQGTDDGAVPHQQGVMLYNTLRRMGKNAVFLSYLGENHNNARRPNQLDYARRLRHFLDVYLKGVPAEPWVKEGVPYIRQVP